MTQEESLVASEQSSLDKRAKQLFIGSTLFISTLWLLLSYDALYSAGVIWLGNEIFNHCALVIPASLYLIWERRGEIAWSEAKSSNLALFFLFGQLVLFLLGIAGDIRLFQHVAVFAMLPTLFWCFMGNRIAWQLKFPLLFVMFSVPVGEELIPFLQEITADISVYMLQMTGIPLFRSGLFIEIPQGKFLVAEACSGVSFLIASIVIGNLYAYMNLQTMSRRVFFVVLSVVVPIFANAVRVYGIILVGYWSDMKHAVGADHLIYGWFFFAFVIIMLIAIGEWIRSRERKALNIPTEATSSDENGQLDESKKSTHTVNNSVNNGIDIGRQSGPRLAPLTAILLTLFIMLSLLQAYRMSHLTASTSPYPDFTLNLATPTNSAVTLEWSPRFVRATKQFKQSFMYENREFDVFYAYFDGSEGELVSSLHRIYEQDRWTLTDRERTNIEGKPLVLENVTSSIGIQRAIYYFYIVDGQWTVSRKGAKLQQVLKTLKGEQSQGAFIAVSFIKDNQATIESENAFHGAALSIVKEYISEKYLNE